ncbi:MAG: hypothetical protein R3E31_15950 [Chloroflexota bacterium]
MTLQPTQERALWHAAGSPCHSARVRAATTLAHVGATGRPLTVKGNEDASQYVAGRLQTQLDQAISNNYLNDEELATLRAAHTLAPAFAGERPTRVIGITVQQIGW